MWKIQFKPLARKTPLMAKNPKPATAPKHAMVLAAGLGTRMRPFNGRVPKPLVPVGGKALIDYVLDRLAAQGVERAVVNVHHLADQIEQHLAGRKRPKIVSRTSEASFSAPAAAWSRRCRNSAMAHSSTSIPTRSGSMA